MVVEEIALPAEFELFLDAQSDVLRFEAARVFAFERTRHADLLSPSSRDELAAGAAIPRQRYLDAQALIARCRTLFAAAIAPFDLLLSASAPGEAPAGLGNTGEAMFNRWTSGLHVPCVNVPGFSGPGGLPVGVQLIGAHGEDLRLLRCAKWIAARIGERRGRRDQESERAKRAASRRASWSSSGVRYSSRSGRGARQVALPAAFERAALIAIHRTHERQQPVDRPARDAHQRSATAGTRPQRCSPGSGHNVF